MIRKTLPATADPSGVFLTHDVLATLVKGIETPVSSAFEYIQHVVVRPYECAVDMLYFAQAIEAL